MVVDLCLHQWTLSAWEINESLQPNPRKLTVDGPFICIVGASLTDNSLFIWTVSYILKTLVGLENNMNFGISTGILSSCDSSSLINFNSLKSVWDQP